MDDKLFYIIFKHLTKSFGIHPTGEYPYRIDDKDISIVYYLELETEISDIFGISVHEASVYLDKWMKLVGLSDDYPNVIQQYGFALTPEQEEVMVREMARTIDAQIIAKILEMGAEDASISAASEILDIPPEELSGEDE